MLAHVAKISSSTGFRLMSVFPPDYINPIYSRKKQTQLQRNEKHKQFTHLPTKPSKHDESESVFHHELVQKIINYITKKGNKVLARELLEKSFECIKQMQVERYNLVPESERESVCCVPEEVLIRAINNCRPLLQLVSIKRGGVTYQVPVPINDRRSFILGMKWLLDAGTEKEKKVSFSQKLAWEIVDAANGYGRVVKHKNDLHRQCEANRAYAHYRWS